MKGYSDFFVCFCCVQALHTHLRFSESWFRAENSSGFERVSNCSFYLLERDAAGHISMFKILFSVKVYISNAKGKSMKSHGKEHCNSSNRDLCEKPVFVLQPRYNAKIVNWTVFLKYKKKNWSRGGLGFFIPSSSVMEGVFKGRKPDSLKLILWNLND